MKFEIIIGKDHPILRTPCEPMKKNEISKYIQIFSVLKDYICDSKNKAVGIAAPQIGISKQFFCINLYTSDLSSYRTLCMINPIIEEMSSETDIEEEGCLSLPGIQGEIARSRRIKVFYLDEKGCSHRQWFTEYAARVIQHEYDHLRGILFIDRV